MTEPRQDEPPVCCSDCEGLREQLEDLQDKYDALEADALKLKDDVEAAAKHDRDNYHFNASDTQTYEILGKAVREFENSTGKETCRASALNKFKDEIKTVIRGMHYCSARPDCGDNLERALKRFEEKS